MNKLTKIDLIHDMNVMHRIPVSVARKAIGDLFKRVQMSLDEGKVVEIRGFGQFKVVVRKPKTAYNFKDKVVINIPERQKIVFRSFKKIKKFD